MLDCGRFIYHVAILIKWRTHGCEDKAAFKKQIKLAQQSNNEVGHNLLKLI